MDEQFRPAPKKSATLVAWTAMLLLGFALGPLLAGATLALSIRAAGWDGATLLYGPFAQTISPFLHLFHGYPLEPWIHRAPILVGVMSIVVAAVIAWIVPARESAGGESFLLAVGEGIAVSVAGAVALDASVWRDYLADPLLPRLVLGGAAALLVVAIERRAVVMLRTFRSLSNIGSRAGWWAVRIPAGYALFAFAGLASGYLPVAIAAGAAAGLTLLQSLAMRATGERRVVVTEHTIGVAAAVSTLLALVFIAASIVVFGHPLAARRPTALVLDRGRAALESVTGVDARIRTRKDELTVEKELREPIRIQWSRERKAEEPKSLP